MGFPHWGTRSNLTVDSLPPLGLPNLWTDASARAPVVQEVSRTGLGNKSQWPSRTSPPALLASDNKTTEQWTAKWCKRQCNSSPSASLRIFLPKS